MSEQTESQSIESQAWTIQRVLQWSTDFLRQRGFDTARLDCELLLAHGLNLSRIQLYTNFDKPMLPEERNKFRAMLQRRVTGEPVAYLLGYKEFYGRRFDVDSAVLIPRPETEHLVEEALACANKIALAAPRILEIGVGSGCLLVSLACEIPAATIEGWDISAEALVVAARNVATHVVQDRVSLLCCDALAEKSWEVAQQFDLLVANPPYISIDDQAVQANVKKFEPAAALFAGDDGLVFYRQIAAWAGKVLVPDSGMICLEIGKDQQAMIEQIFADHGWTLANQVRDYSGIVRVLTFKAGVRL